MLVLLPVYKCRSRVLWLQVEANEFEEMQGICAVPRHSFMGREGWGIGSAIGWIWKAQSHTKYEFRAVGGVAF